MSKVFMGATYGAQTFSTGTGTSQSFGSGGVVQSADPNYIKSGETLYSPAPPQDYTAATPSDTTGGDSSAGKDVSTPTGETPIDTGGGTSQQSDESTDTSGGTGISTISPIMLIGGAALIYFLFFRKKA